MHTMDCITKKKEVKEAMVNINPEGLASSYNNKYPLMEPGVEIEKIPPSSIHKFIKMALMLKNNGIELEVASTASLCFNFFITSRCTAF